MLDAIRAAILTTSTEDGESRIIDATHALHCLATATGYLIAGVPEGLRLGALRAFARCAAGTADALIRESNPIVGMGFEVPKARQ